MGTRDAGHGTRTRGGLSVPHPPSPVPERGSILIYVVWAVLLLSMFAASTATQAAYGLSLTERMLAQLQAVQLTHGAAEYVRLLLADDQTPKVDGWQESWSNDVNLFRNHAVGEGTFSVMSEGAGGVGVRFGVADEERRVNLNAAPLDVLEGLVQAVGGLPQEQAAQVAAAILDWRDPDGREERGGAESVAYRSMSPPYDCKNGPFESVEELLLVKGVTPPVYQRLEPYVTVYGAGAVNLNTVSRAVLRAMGLSLEGAEGLLQFRVGEDGVEGTADDRLVASLGAMQGELSPYVPGEDMTRLEALAREDVFGVGAQAFRMTIEAQTRHRASKVTVQAVMRRDGTIALWEEQ